MSIDPTAKTPSQAARAGSVSAAKFLPSILVSIAVLCAGACTQGDEEMLTKKLDGWQQRFAASTARTKELFASKGHQLSPLMLNEHCIREQKEIDAVLAEMKRDEGKMSRQQETYETRKRKVSVYSEELTACIAKDFQKIPWARSRTHY